MIASTSTILNARFQGFIFFLLNPVVISLLNILENSITGNAAIPSYLILPVAEFIADSATGTIASYISFSCAFILDNEVCSMKSVLVSMLLCTFVVSGREPKSSNDSILLRSVVRYVSTSGTNTDCILLKLNVIDTLSTYFEVVLVRLPPSNTWLIVLVAICLPVIMN